MRQGWAVHPVRMTINCPHAGGGCTQGAAADLEVVVVYLARQDLAPVQAEVPVEELGGGEDDGLRQAEDQVLRDQPPEKGDPLQEGGTEKEALDPGQAVTEGGSHHLQGGG